MLQVRVTTFLEIRQVPKTQALREQQFRSMDPHQRWWAECLEYGAIGSLTTPWGKWVPVDSLYKEYQAWCRDQNTSRPLDKMEFGRQMSKLMSASKSQPRRGLGRSNDMRSLIDARRVLDIELGTDRGMDGGGGLAPP